jgi:hypothetical protein
LSDELIEETIMDLYLPADFYQLRDDLSDWRDAPAASREPDVKHAPSETGPRDRCADPLWKVF